MENKKKCPECRQQSVVIKSAKGRSFPWKDFLAVELAYDFDVPTCESCNDVFLTSPQIRELDELLEKSIRKCTSALIGKMRDALGMTQKAISSQVRLSEVYLSELASEKKTPSAQTFNYLKLIADNPHLVRDLNSIRVDKPKELSSEEISSLKKKLVYVNFDSKTSTSRSEPFENILLPFAGEVNNREKLH